MTALVIAEHDNASIKSATLNTVTAAVMSAPLFALHTAGFPAWLARGLAGLAVKASLGARYLPGAGDWRPGAHDIERDSRTSHDPERGALQDLWMTAYPKLRMGGATFPSHVKLGRGSGIEGIGKPQLYCTARV